MRTSIFSAAAATALAFAGLGAAADADEWKSRSIYQVMIDRYAHDDGSTDTTCEMHLFCGGTWKGLKNKLDYIQGEQHCIRTSSAAPCAEHAANERIMQTWASPPSRSAPLSRT